MSKADKASEPSMDEILASIRKIIAEEPVSGRNAAAPGAVSADPGSNRGGAASKPKQDEPHVKADASLRTEAKVDTEGPVGEAHSSRLRQTPPGQAMSTADRPVAMRDPLKPFFPDVAQARPVAANAAPQVAGQQAVDFGAIVPRRPGDSLFEPPAAPGDRRPQPGRLPEWLARSSPASQGRPTGPLPPPAEPTRLPPRDAMPVGASLADGPGLRGSVSVSIPPPPGVGAEGAQRSALAGDGKSSDVSRGAPVGAAAGAIVAGPAPSGEKSDTSETLAAVAKSPSSGHEPQPSRAAGMVTAPAAQAVASPGVTPGTESGNVLPPKVEASQGHLNGASGPIEPAAIATHKSIPAEPAGPRIDRPLPVAEPSAAVSKPAALADRGKPSKPVSHADLTPTAASPGGVRTLEDTVVDLLRPMIRQWLDDNMPRMVEKALRIELAQSVKAKSEPSKH